MYWGTFVLETSQNRIFSVSCEVSTTCVLQHLKEKCKMEAEIKNPPWRRTISMATTIFAHTTTASCVSGGSTKATTG